MWVTVSGSKTMVYSSRIRYMSWETGVMFCSVKEASPFKQICSSPSLYFMVHVPIIGSASLLTREEDMKLFGLPVIPTMEFIDNAISEPVCSLPSSLSSCSSINSSSSPSVSWLDIIITLRCLFLHIWVGLYFSSQVKHSPNARFLSISYLVIFLNLLLFVLAELDIEDLPPPPFVFEFREVTPTYEACIPHFQCLSRSVFLHYHHCGAPSLGPFLLPSLCFYYRGNPSLPREPLDRLYHPPSFPASQSSP
ncbi:uncharacterized protein G2W53_026375 [Senna tora]|uniref:Uncharacterized protein n=1 Tax=Senna tora TaxID=362788 RepID=A0A834TFM2_9FABA|nr:uncharacterized protein G2W53_026375 [Senna tora]